jgi:hypothetical protein
MQSPPSPPSPLQDGASKLAAALVTKPAAWFLHHGELYFSWGYNAELWDASDIHIVQRAEHSDFTLHNVRAHDERHFEDGPISAGGGLFAFTVPQYNVRLGGFLNPSHTVGTEISYDHTKYTSYEEQVVHVTGRVQGQPVDKDVHVTPQVFSYQLHNGANHVMWNMVGRWPVLGSSDQHVSVLLVGKAGAGIMLPHPDNTVLGHNSDVGPKSVANAFGLGHGWWQLSGVTTGVEGGFQVIPVKPFFLEFTTKAACAALFDIPVYRGTATQPALCVQEVIFNMGMAVGARATPARIL